jgi:hypothetical protein
LERRACLGGAVLLGGGGFVGLRRVGQEAGKRVVPWSPDALQVTAHRGELALGKLIDQLVDLVPNRHDRSLHYGGGRRRRDPAEIISRPSPAVAADLVSD